jgi:hypothetical protein
MIHAAGIVASRKERVVNGVPNEGANVPVVATKETYIAHHSKVEDSRGGVSSACGKN